MSLSPIERLAEVTGSTALAGFRDEERYTRREEISAALTQALRARTTRDWLEALRAADLWCAPVKTYAEVVEDPQVQWNRAFAEIDHPRAGRVRLLAHPIRYDGQPPPIVKRPPLLGEDTDDVLRELGYGAADIERLRRVGAI